MLPDIAEQKNNIRRHARQLRLALDETLRARASLAICEQIARWPEFLSARVILTYMPIKAEVDLRPLLEKYPQKQWLLPRIIPGAAHSMAFHPYDPARLVLHPYGMLEPAQDLPVIAPGEIQLALVPGLAYSRAGWRLGYGGGYYDRFLKSFTGVSMGISFEALLFDELPHDEHDLPVEWLASEERLFRAEN